MAGQQVQRWWVQDETQQTAVPVAPVGGTSAIADTAMERDIAEELPRAEARSRATLLETVGVLEFIEGAKFFNRRRMSWRALLALFVTGGVLYSLMAVDFLFLRHTILAGITGILAVYNLRFARDWRRQAQWKPPVLRVTPQGIIVRPPGCPELSLPWEEVGDIRAAGTESRQFVLIDVRNPAAVLERVPANRRSTALFLMKRPDSAAWAFGMGAKDPSSSVSPAGTRTIHLPEFQIGQPAPIAALRVREYRDHVRSAGSQTD